MKRTMIMVVVALMPALLFGFYNTGYLHFLSQGVQPEFWASLWFGFLKVLPIIVVSYVVGLGIEFAFAQARGHEVNEGFLVTGLLIPMIMPVDIPLWMVALATAFSVIFGKEVFGGTGMNVFNPALLARAFAFFAYTPSMSGATVWIAGLSSGEGVVDGFSGATALENLSTTGRMGYSAMDAFLGFIPGCVGETSTLAILIGGVVIAFNWRQLAGQSALPVPETRNPTELRAALGFGLLYAGVLLCAAWLSDIAGRGGLYLLAFVSGLTDVDAITLSTLRLLSVGKLDAAPAAVAILLAMLANLAFKSTLAFTLGGSILGRRVVGGMLAVGAGIAGGIAWLAHTSL